MLRVGLIGAGLIGGKRTAQMKGGKLVAVSDLAPARAKALADMHGAAVEERWQNLVRRADVDLVIVSTANDAIPECAIGALQASKHILVEKPAGRTAAEVRQIAAAADAARKVAGVGFNHRFHPAFIQAKRLLDSGQFGPLMYIRARYGHGGRIGYDREWRADPKISGGGELLDQGVHLIDLSRWLGGEFNLKWGAAKTFFWDMPVEDNGFLLLSSADEKRMAFLHASCTEWKNLFDFEIFCRNAKIEVWGLGRSYGVEELRCYRMKPEMGPPEIDVTKFPEEDASWQTEFDAMLAKIEGRPSAIATLEDAARTLDIVQATYEQAACSA
jgi:predicted dehydrogenase